MGNIYKNAPGQKVSNDTIPGCITSNIFAILGLRALYFTLSGLVDLFTYLKYGVALILFYVGIKMMLSNFVHIHTGISLAIIGFLLIGSIVFSIVNKKKHTGNKETR